MIPGLAGGPPFPKEAKKDSIVAIASVEKPSVPMVVGVCEVDISGLQKVSGEKGRAVRGVHWEGDELWAWNTSDTSGGSAPERIVGWEGFTQLQCHTEEEGSCEVTDDAQDDGGVSLNRVHSADRSILNEASAKPENGDDAQQNEGHVDQSQELSTKGKLKFAVKQGPFADLMVPEIDDAFRNAFLYAIYEHKATHKGEQHFGLQFPISQSFLISNLILPFLPIFTPAQAASLQMKKTSWKSARKFIKHLEKTLIVKSKDRNGGETLIINVDFEDRAILEFAPYKLPKKETGGADGHGGKQTSSGETTGDGSIDQYLKLITMFRPKEKVAPVFELSGSSVKSMYLRSELGSIITTYLESEGLISATNKRLINLNLVLANAVFDGQASIDREVLSKGNVPRDVLMDRIMQSCSPFWVILRDNETEDDVKPKAGTAPKVQITLETRSGNKTMTKISGVEAFRINPQLLADELQKTCASSTSVTQLVGSSPKNPVKEILVQGPQKDAVSKALERRGVSKQWINVLDKTKGKKK